MAEHTAFFYGTLMAPKILYRVIFGTTTPQPHQTAFLTIRPALLPGFRRHRVKHVDYPGITPVTSTPSSTSSSSSPSSPPPSVLGTYITGLAPQDLYRLDCFEGNEYERRDVGVNLLKGSVEGVQGKAAKGVRVGETEGEVETRGVKTQTYVYLDAGNLEGEEWDFEGFKREKMRAWTLERDEEYHDIPYNEAGGAEAEVRDGTAGRGAGGHITRQLEGEGETKGNDGVTRSAV